VGDAQAAKVQKREANLRNRHQPQVTDATTNPSVAAGTMPSSNNSTSKHNAETTSVGKGIVSKGQKHNNSNNNSHNSNSSKAKSPMRRPGFEGRFKKGEFLNQKA
jgi:hypothetical protein